MVNNALMPSGCNYEELILDIAVKHDEAAMIFSANVDHGGKASLHFVDVSQLVLACSN